MKRQTLTEEIVAGLEPKDRAYEVGDGRQIGLYVRIQPSGRKTWFAMLARGQKFTIGEVGRIRLVDARSSARTAIREFESGNDPRKAKRKGMTLGAFVDEVYGPWAQANLKSADSQLRRIRTAWRGLMKVKLVDVDLARVEAERQKRLKAGPANVTANKDLARVEAEPQKRLKSGPTHGTINKDTAALRAVLKRAVESGDLESHPLKEMARLTERFQHRVRFLSEDEEARLRTGLAERDESRRIRRESFNRWRQERGLATLVDLRKTPFVDHLTPLIVLAMNTGLRRGEIFSLRWRDADLADRMIRIADSKSGRPRHVPMNDEVFETLKGWRAMTAGGPDDLVFPGEDGARLDNITSGWGSIVRRAGLTDFRFHDLRHHAASMMVQSGVPLHVVGVILGHSTLAMTQRYAHLAPAQLRQAVAAIGSRRAANVVRGNFGA